MFSDFETSCCICFYTIEAALDSPRNQSEDDTYSEETMFLEVIRDLGGRHEIMLRIAKLEKMQGPYDQWLSMDESDEEFDDSSVDSFGISSGASSLRDPEKLSRGRSG